MADGVVWDLTGYFPSFESPERTAFMEQLSGDLERLAKETELLGSLNDQTADDWEACLLQLEDAAARLGHLRSYVECLESAHTEREAYALAAARLDTMAASLEKIEGTVIQAIKAVRPVDYERFIARESLAPIQRHLARLKEKSRFIMGPEAESLASDLGVDGLHAWGRLYNKVSGRLAFTMTYPDGKTEQLPIARWRALLADPDREVGKAAFTGGNQAWETVAEACAAALNALAGTRLTLNLRRGIDDYLYPARFQAGIQKDTLNAMYRAIYDHLEIPRAIFRVKASYGGRSGIAFFEREAPLPLPVAARYAWSRATAMVTGAFQSAYPDLGDYFRSLLEKRWVESQSRANKRPGAFCTDSVITGEQRIYMTFNGNLGDVTTLAHEVGHAWHSHLMGDLRPLARQYPMTLAETASIFAEQILAEGIYQDPAVTDAEKLLMLDADLCGAAVLLLDITVRFEFEKAFHDERMEGEVPVSRLKSLMTATQRRVFGSALLDDGEDPLFWASKLHFYISDLTFYNFPYTFGFLLSRFIVDRFREEGPGFLPRYEAFLRMTGSAPVETVVADTLGQDISNPSFWSDALQTLETPLERYREHLKNPHPTSRI